MRIAERNPRGPAAARQTHALEMEQWVQLATRIPRALHRALKLHCVHAEITLSRFVVIALADKLRRAGRGGGSDDGPQTRAR